MKGHRRAAATVLGLALVASSAWTTPAMAHGSRADRSARVGPTMTMAEGLTSPLLGLAVRNRGSVYVSQTFAGVLSKVHASGSREDVVQEPGQGIAGVDIAGKGSVVYAVTGAAPGASVGLVKLLKRDGTTRELGDTAAFEAAENPDKVNSYGFQGLPAECKALWPSPPPFPEYPPADPYSGQVDSNTYAVAKLPHGAVAAVDAGGNSVLRVKRGKVSLIAVLPPIPVTVTAQAAEGMGLPGCVAGATYNLEPVPTDVEVGPRGMLYVSALPGGPEDGSLGALGSVFKVNPRSGEVTLVASGFQGAVDLAVTPKGIYVAELYGNSVSKVVNGAAVKVADVPSPGAIDYRGRGKGRGTLYVTSGNGFPDFGQPNGSIVTIKVG